MAEKEKRETKKPKLGIRGTDSQAETEQYTVTGKYNLAIMKGQRREEAVLTGKGLAGVKDNTRRMSENISTDIDGNTNYTTNRQHWRNRQNPVDDGKSL